MTNERATATHEPKRGYDVFLNFRGEDTRLGFTGHLYNALRQKRVKTFIDDQELRRGDLVWDAINKAIQQSRISIVVLSENYASSRWCLRELVNILECKKKRNQRVLPVFYNVDPSDVRHLRHSYGKAMANHEQRYGSDSEEVQKWKSALYEVANLTGFPSNDKYEYQIIQSIVEKVTKSLPLHHVFLSFRGEDTRHTFTGFLYEALRHKGLNTFMDDEGLEGGDQLSPSLLQAIEQSSASIIVFSENYADSSWCLEELVKIIECMKNKHQTVWPIYYRVKPSDVFNQENSYGEAMNKHENKLGRGSDKVKKWRSALSAVANLEKWQFDIGYEYEFIQKIVESVMESLQRYDVILSFHGQDSRYTFTGHFYNALRRKGIKTFVDDGGLEDGDQISQSLINAIEESRLSIIVFSENYAYSSGCLEKLVFFHEYNKKKNHLVWPIFYKVEPSDVRHQTNSYANAMDAYENEFVKDSEKVKKWKTALSEVANLKGWHFKTGYEYEFIQKIVELVPKIELV